MHVTVNMTGLSFSFTSALDCRTHGPGFVTDSDATFSQQAEECGWLKPWITALKNNAVATFTKLSFAITSPGMVAADGSD